MIKSIEITAQKASSNDMRAGKTNNNDIAAGTLKPIECCKSLCKKDGEAV